MQIEQQQQPSHREAEQSQNQEVKRAENGRHKTEFYSHNVLVTRIVNSPDENVIACVNCIK